MNFHVLSLTALLQLTGNWIYGAIGHKCPGLIADSRTSPRGNFSSPAWPAPYPPDAVCNYRLQGVPWEGVKITFHHFDLEAPYTAGCLSDYLELATVDVEGTRQFRGRFCGNTVPTPILLLHPTVELVFRSNHAVHHEGFYASYEFVDEAQVAPPRLNGTSPCGGVVTGIGGIITSPGYPIGYSAGLDCLWLIRVPYSHAIYVRIQQLEFQGSIANCEKAELGIYDGYEHSLESGEALKKYCGDLRYYKNEEERVVLSSRNRLLIRFQTREPSKPVEITIPSSEDFHVGFRVIWSDVEFNTPENCSKLSRFACTEARFCFTKNHIGGASNCPDLRHYCISSNLVCDNLAHCSEHDPSDEQNCYPQGIVLLIILIPLALLLLSLFSCYLCYKRRKGRMPQKSSQQSLVKPQEDLQNCWSKVSGCQGNSSGPSQAFLVGLDLAPIPRLPGSLRANQLQESPVPSDIMSPASGFSDSESETGSGAFLTHSTYCPAHGPTGPLRHLPLHYPILPVLQEGSGYGSETFDEAGSTISSQNSEDLLNVSILYEKDFKEQNCQAVQSWRKNQLRTIHGSDAVSVSDDAKSSEASSPSRVCPRCLEKEGRPMSVQSSLTSAGLQFDSGVDSIKNISFDNTSIANFNNASIQTDETSGGDSSSVTNNSFSTTVTTFGIKDADRVKDTRKFARATDV